MTATVNRARERARIERERVDSAVIVRPIGPLDSELVADVRQVILEAHAPAVVDLSGSVFIDPAAVQRFATGWEMFRPRMAVVCHGPTGRQLLVRAGLHEHLAIFEQVSDALFALASSTEDLDGWSPGPRP